MYRIDHLAFRTLDRVKCVDFFCKALGYRIQANFDIFFDEEKQEQAFCTALEPCNRQQGIPWLALVPVGELHQEYVLAPEIFVSEGTPGSIVYNWAMARNGGGLHHIALQVPETSTVEIEMQRWLQLGWAEGFTSDHAIHCDGLSQVFTTPSKITGVVFELIHREGFGFCKDSVRELMESTRGD